MSRFLWFTVYFLVTWA